MGVTNDFTLQRMGVMMEPEAGNLHEAEGVLNPAVVRNGPVSQLHTCTRNGDGLGQASPNTTQGADR